MDRNKDYYAIVPQDHKFTETEFIFVRVVQRTGDVYCVQGQFYETTEVFLQMIEDCVYFDEQNDTEAWMLV